ncbi:MAG: hypothetical protein LBL45_12830 [Treponema sp.]|nr:hypothetical protein [Treponema sp.]
MDKRIFLSALLGAAFFAAGAGMAVARDNLAVLPFTGGERGEGETIAELFSFNEELNAVFTPIPRTSISLAIGSERRFQLSAGMTDPDTIAAIGRQLGAQYVVAGNITRLGSRNLLIISIMKIDELRQVSGDIQTYARIEEVQSLLPGMARNIIAASGVNVARIDKLAVVPVEMGGNINSREADTLAQILSIYLIRSGKYAVYPRTATLAQVRAEYSTQLSGVTADENMVSIGKGENPRFVLSVAARRLGTQNMFNAAIIDMESGAQIAGRSENYGALDEGIEAMGRLAGRLTGADLSSLIADMSGEAPGEAAARARAEAESRSARDQAQAAAMDQERAAARARARAGGAAFGYGILNLALGLGSYIQGDFAGFGVAFLSYGAAAGLIWYELAELSADDDFANVPGTIGVGIAGFAVLYGFIRPFVYQKNRALVGVLDRIQVAAVPADRGRTAVRFSYTVRF